jgi:hypothetical protein
VSKFFNFVAPNFLTRHWDEILSKNIFHKTPAETLDKATDKALIKHLIRPLHIP